jgi:hypothetical protein
VLPTCTQVFSEGLSTFCLLAVIRQNRNAQASQHLHGSLVSAVRKALRQRVQRSASAPTGLPTGGRSPLLSAFHAVNDAFSKLHGSLDDSIYPQTSVSACLLNTSSQAAYSLWYGEGSQPSWFTCADGSVVPPSTSRTSYSSQTNIREEFRGNLDSECCLMLGSPGLWCAPAACTPSCGAWLD